MDPTKEQRLAIEYPDSLVAIARPGSGKTFMLSRKIAEILAKSAEHRGLIAISYTNKASDELRRRAVAAGAPGKGSFFGTIDKFCDGEIIIPFLPHLWGRPGTDVSIMRIRDLPDEERGDFDGFTENQVTLKNVEDNATMLRDRFLKGQLFLETAGALALYTVTNSAACRRYVRARYSHVIIDEYQDSGLEQHELFLFLKGLGLVAVAVGDADQSIFGFSNKDSKYLLSLPDKGFKLFPITFNHRCHASIINYSLRLINKNAVLLDSDETRVFEKSCAGMADSIAKWIDSVLPKVMVEYEVEKQSDVGILVRGGASGLLVDGALATKHRYFDAHPLEEHFDLWAKLFCQLLAYRCDATATAQQIMDSTSCRLSDKEARSARAEMKKLRECPEAELFDQMEKVAGIFLPNARKQTSVELLRASNPVALLRHFAPANDDEVQVMSLHKSKGLEFDIVFHLDLYEWVLPCKRPGDDGDFEYPSWSQDLNLHYVGITRARKACFLCTSSRRMNSQNQVKTGNLSEFLQIGSLAKLRLRSIL